MYLSKDGITVEVIHPIDINRFKAAGYVEAEVGYPNPETVVDGESAKPKSKTQTKPKAEAKPADEPQPGGEE